MSKAQLLIAVMVAIDCGTALFYGIAGDWRRALYWLCCAVCNVVITW